MASLDLGTLVAKIKAEGTEQAKKAFQSVGDAAKGAGTSATGSTTGFKSLKDSFVSSIGQTKLLGTNLGSLTGALGSSEAMAGILGGVMAGVVTAGILLAFEAIKKLTQAIVDFVKETAKLGIGFQAEMSKVQAITGATGNDMNTLTEGAKKFGATTVFSASEAAQAMEYMGMAGWKTEQIMSGMPGVLNLAASSGESLARTSDIVTDTLTALGESASEAGRLSDVMAAAATNSNTNVSMMGETFKYAAPVAGALGYAMEDLALSTGLMANAGIKGEMAGTTLRSLFTNMVKPTKTMQAVMDEYNLSLKNVDGTMKPLNQVILELRKAMQGVDASTRSAAIATLAGKEAMSGTLAIVNASEEDYKKLSDAINGSAGASAKMAETMNNNIAGLQKSINSKMESIKLSMFSVFEPFISGFLKVYDAFLGLSEKMWGAVGGVLSRITGLITPFIDIFVNIFKTALDLIWPLVEPFFKFIEANLNGVMRSLQLAASVVGSVVTSIKDALMPLVNFINNTLMIIVDVLNGNWQSAGERIKVWAGQFADAVCAILLFIPNTIVNTINAVTSKLNDFFGLNIKQIDKFETHFAKKSGELTDNVGKHLENLELGVEETTDNIYSSFSDLYRDVESLTGDHYDNLKGLAKGYNEEYTTIDKVFDDYVRNKVREREKEIDKLNEKNANTSSLEYMMHKAKELLRVQQEAEREISAEREQNENKYITLLQNAKNRAEQEENSKAKIIESGNKLKQKHYREDVKNFEDAEKDKTRIAKEQEGKRSGLGGGIMQGFMKSLNLPGYANGTINSRGEYALVGEFGPEIVRLNKGDSVHQINNNFLNGGTNNETNGLLQSLRIELSDVKRTIADLPRTANYLYRGVPLGGGL
ncbi:MAG: phage tail tape measure protein family [Clostridia bacterium]|jgi:TP901 family phage tail tape measure protein|nr:phage tail tape measure protein family [Clostridia bacterium]